jgi:DNA-binding MarR family transcriptional regulator
MKEIRSSEIEEVQELFSHIMRGLRHFPTRKQFPGDVTFEQMRVLWFLDSKGTCAMGDVAQMLSVTRPTATSVVNRLVLRGFVGRQRDKTDRRVVRLRLCPKGASLLAARRSLFRDRVRQMLSPMTKNQRGRFVAALRTVCTQVDGTQKVNRRSRSSA